MKFRDLCLVAALGAIAGCGDSNTGALGPGGSGGAGGAGGTGDPQLDRTTFRLTCENGTLQLDIPIELVVELTEPYSNSHSTEATFSAAVILDEESVASLINAGAMMIDISASVTTNVTGATPATMTASLGAAPLEDFDLQADRDDNGIPGPHRIELDPMTAASNAAPEATEVAFKLDFDGISLTLDIFNIPADCFGPSLVGVALSFPVTSD